MSEALIFTEGAAHKLGSPRGDMDRSSTVSNDSQQDRAHSQPEVTKSKANGGSSPMTGGAASVGPLSTDEVLQKSLPTDSSTSARADNTQSEEAAYSESGVSESCSSITNVVQPEPGCQNLLSYVSSCAQYAQQVALWCGQSESSSSGLRNSPVAHVDSKRELVRQWLTRPARRQVLATEIQNTSHCEGQNEYNIWYGRHLTDRYNRPSHTDRDAAGYRCNPELDAGYTAADTQPGSSEPYFCAFFAKGCCTKGSECRYKHRIPTLEDEYTLDWSRDIFGRERHKDHRDDMGGAGSFNHECKTLFVGGLQVDPMEQDGIQGLERFLWESFGAWGDVETVRVIPKKLIGFVTYAYRVQAEFAKVAMADQNFGKYGSLLSVKWAHQDGNAKRKNSVEEPSKKQRIGDVTETLPPRQPEQPGEDAVRQTLESYCSAWQAYWASHVAEGSAGAGSLTQNYALLPEQGAAPQQFNLDEHHGTSCIPGDTAQQWPSEEGKSNDEDTQRLQSILNRIDGLSTADFLKAGVIESGGV